MNLTISKERLLPYFGSKKRILDMFEPSQVLGHRRKERHVYVNNNAPVLLVAHIDTVKTPFLKSACKGSGFDDRLGVFAGHELTKAHPDVFDLLLTDYEETCETTATYFEPEHDYNLVVELDREGENFVTYGLADETLIAALKKHGFTKAYGSFSDIVSLNSVDCGKINVGLGTFNSHGQNSGFSIAVFKRQVNRLLSFCDEYKTVPWPSYFDEWQSFRTYTVKDSSKEYTTTFGDWGRCSICGDWSDNCVRLDSDRNAVACEFCAPCCHNDGRYVECGLCGKQIHVTESYYDNIHDCDLCVKCFDLLYYNAKENSYNSIATKSTAKRAKKSYPGLVPVDNSD